VLDELLAELTWPKLWRAARLALRPARVGLATFYLLGAALLLSLADRIDRTPDHNILAEHLDQSRTGLITLASAVRKMDLMGASAGLLEAFILAPVAAIQAAPVTCGVIGLALLIWTAVMGGAISRSAATELAWARTIPWPTALAMALSRWKSLVGAMVIPLMLIWLAAFALMITGWALFSVGILSLIGGLGWILFLVVGAVATLVMLGWCLGQWLLVPAVMCEGADAIDAVQHSFAMVFARPLRLIVCLLMLLVQGVLLALAVGLVTITAIALAKVCAGAWLDADHRAILGGTTSILPVDGASVPGIRKAGAGLVKVTTTVFGAAAIGVIVSYVWCAATALFLVMRRACDGQDISELWSPGMIGGTMSATTAAGGGVAIVPPTRASTARPEGIVDNGPADEG